MRLSQDLISFAKRQCFAKRDPTNLSPAAQLLSWIDEARWAVLQGQESREPLPNDTKGKNLLIGDSKAALKCMREHFSRVSSAERFGPEAHLYGTGISGAIDLKDVHQCSGSPSRWEFFMA
jgi:hypothetical protein